MPPVTNRGRWLGHKCKETFARRLFTIYSNRLRKVNFASVKGFKSRPVQPEFQFLFTVSGKSQKKLRRAPNLKAKHIAKRYGLPQNIATVIAEQMGGRFDDWQ